MTANMAGIPTVIDHPRSPERIAAGQFGPEPNGTESPPAAVHRLDNPSLGANHPPRLVRNADQVAALIAATGVVNELVPTGQVMSQAFQFGIEHLLMPIFDQPLSGPIDQRLDAFQLEVAGDQLP